MLNIERLYSVIETVNVVGIKEVIIKKDDDGVMIFGADSTDESIQPSVVLISPTDSDIISKTMGISRVPVMLNRMQLFDLSKTKLTQEETDNYVQSVTLKESRKKVSFTFANPKTINVPSGTIDDNVNNSITLSKDYITNLIKATQAMSSELISVSGINNEITIELFDGGTDTFTDVVSDTCVGEWNYHWRTDSVMKLLRQAIKNDDSVELGISDLGILYVEVNDLLFMVMPQVL